MGSPDFQRNKDRGKAEIEAADWLARLDAGLGLGERQEFERWLAEAPNERAWQELDATWTALDRARRSGLAPGMVGELRARRRRRTAFRGALGAVALAGAAAGVLIFRSASPAPLPAADQRPVVVRAEHRLLPDRSIVDLDQGAEIEVSYSPERRDVRLLRGEAQFTVAKNPSRPFVVAAGNLRVRAVGTEFAVALGRSSTDLLVTEGRVSVEEPAPGPRASAASAAAPILVSAGSLLTLPNKVPSSGGSTPRIEKLPIAEIERRLDWRRTRIELSGTPLSAAVEAFNREAGAGISVADARLAALRMSGVFRADNADAFVRLLQSNYGVRVERRGGETILSLGR